MVGRAIAAAPFAASRKSITGSGVAAHYASSAAAGQSGEPRIVSLADETAPIAPSEWVKEAAAIQVFFFFFFFFFFFPLRW